MNDRRGSPQESASGHVPALDFAAFVLGVVGMAHMHLGDEPSPEGGIERDLDAASHDIELLELLRVKTKGNLTRDEEQLVEHSLRELKERFAELSRSGT
jgi:hypothetical protein